jgi:hypothetical protein
VPQVNAEPDLSNVEQNRGHERSDPDIPPANDDVGYILEDARKEDRRDAYRHEEIYYVQQNFHA